MLEEREVKKWKVYGWIGYKTRDMFFLRTTELPNKTYIL